jgi:alpha-glucosidase
VLEVDLGFLTDVNRTYRARIFRDASTAHWETNPTAVDISTMEVASDGRMVLELAPGGGAAVYFTPVIK